MYEVSSGFKVLESNMGPYVFVWPIWACHVIACVDAQSLQEFEFQGCQMKGPAAALFGAGAKGRHSNNIKRDWFRQMGDMQFDHRVPW